MKSQDKVTEFKISQFDFVITPLQISLSRSPPQAFSLQFCKGPQLFKKFKESIWLHGSETAFKFSTEQSASFRIQNQKNLVYEWAIYKVNDDDLRDHFASIRTDITQPFVKFIEEFKKIGRQYQKLMNSAQQNVDVAQEWQKYKLNIPNGNVVHALERTKGIDVTFRVDIKCELDGFLQTRKKKQKTIVKSTSKGSHQMSSHPSIDDELLIPQKLIFEQTPSENTNQKIMILNKNETLSDIIEESKESTVLNHDHDERNPKLKSRVSEILQQQQIPSPLHPSIKTQNFDRYALQIKEMNHFQQKSKTSCDLSNEGQEQKQQDQDDKAYEKMLKSSHKLKKGNAKKQEENHIEKQQYYAGLQTAPHSLLKEETVVDNKQKQKQQKIEEVHHKPLHHQIIKIVIVLAVIAMSYYLAVSQNKFGFMMSKPNKKNGKKEEQPRKKQIQSKKQAKKQVIQKQSKSPKKEAISKDKEKPQRKEKSKQKAKPAVQQSRKFKIQEVQQTSTTSKKSRQKPRQNSRRKGEKEEE